MASQAQDQSSRTERSSSIVSAASTNSSNGGWLELTTPSTTNASASTAHTFLELTVAPPAIKSSAKKNSFSGSSTNVEEKANLMMLRARRE